MNTIIKLSHDVTYYKNIISQKSVKYEIYKDEQYKKALTNYNRKTRESNRGPGRKRLQMVH